MRRCCASAVSSGGEPTFLPTDELKTLAEVAAWKTPSGWRVLSFGLSAQDLALDAYAQSGRGFERSVNSSQPPS